MHNLYDYFKSIEDTISRNRLIVSTALVCLCAVSIASIAMSLSFVQKSISSAYVVDSSGASIAHLKDSDDKDLLQIEIRDHVSRFHELMFNLAPNSESISLALDKALLLCDESASRYYRDMTESGFYQRMISANISEQISVEDVEIDSSVYPYRVSVKATVTLIRLSSITTYDFESSCRVIHTQRSPSNPHGLMMESFTVTSSSEKETRKRG